MKPKGTKIKSRHPSGRLTHSLREGLATRGSCAALVPVTKFALNDMPRLSSVLEISKVVSV